REDQRSRAQREESQALVSHKEQTRFDEEVALEGTRGELERLQMQAHSVNEEHAASRAALATLEERLRSEKTSAARLEVQMLQLTARREALGHEMERLGVERARLLADNIELDQRAAQLIEETTAAAGA